MIERVMELEDLIRWLAMPWSQAGNMPIFATELPDGRPLETGQRMEALYREVVGSGRQGQGTYRQCGECRQWYVHFPGSDRHMTDHDVKEMAQQIEQANIL